MSSEKLFLKGIPDDQASSAWSFMQDVSNSPFSTRMISNLLTGRLRTIANFVPQHCILADIGCDHGILSVGLSEHCSKIWAIDSSALAIRGT